MFYTKQLQSDAALYKATPWQSIKEYFGQKIIDGVLFLLFLKEGHPFGHMDKKGAF